MNSVDILPFSLKELRRKAAKYSLLLKGVSSIKTLFHFKTSLII
jgi:hypothetical protein